MSMHPVLLHAFNPGPMTGAGNNTYLIPGRRTVLIDAGVGDPRHLDALSHALDRHGVDLTAVLVTHSHGDHASGAEAIAQRWPDVAFFKFPSPERDAKYPVPWRPIAPDEQIPAGDGTLTAIHTPGHAPDHLVFWDAASRTLYGGDLAVAGTTVVILWSQGGSVREYLDSLHRVMALQLARILPAHGPEIDDPRALLTSYVRHREEREQQVLHALADGGATVDDMVTRIYPELHASPLRRMAAESVRAHLAKLEEEGRVANAPDGETWSVENVERRT
jgi:glyoxylase-like metal-dependent hydrolase (beta-lactamase superfamily II)